MALCPTASAGSTSRGRSDRAGWFLPGPSVKVRRSYLLSAGGSAPSSFSAGFLTTYDPESGIDNCALQRGWMKDRDRVRIWMYRETHNALNFGKYERAGREIRRH